MKLYNYIPKGNCCICWNTVWKQTRRRCHLISSLHGWSVPHAACAVSQSTCCCCCCPYSLNVEMLTGVYTLQYTVINYRHLYAAPREVLYILAHIQTCVWHSARVGQRWRWLSRCCSVVKTITAADVLSSLWSTAVVAVNSDDASSSAGTAVYRRRDWPAREQSTSQY